MIRMRGIDKSYRNSNTETRALENISIDIKRGEFVAIMGPSGCGKSTLLNILGLLDRADAGQYQFLGQQIEHNTESRLSTLRKEHIGFIFQSFNLIDELTVRENIELALQYRSMPRGERQQRVDEVMDSVGIAHRAGHFPGQLSGGQQQRVAIARALAGRPDLLLADEPTGNLDSRHGHDVMTMLRALNEEGTTLVFVTHSAEHADYAHRKIHLFDGRVVNERIRVVA